MMCIPKKYLCHNAVLTLKTADKWGDPAVLVSAALENVRFEPVYRNSRSTENNGAKITARVFVDCVNSSCGIPLMNVGDEYNGQTISAQTVTFSGREYNVEEIKKLYAERKLHHYEVMLSG